ncbi:hypothetical protein ACLNGM_15245 [Aureimonas phyllosphaerae]|uniref:hypothetical protein n=1 Tax=Aureimonas phyllosphaerae TaxID=1166078 RepID=UPI003A5C5203
MTVKLTKAQHDYLGLLAAGDRRCSASYKPAIRLLRDGLAERQRGSIWKTSTMLLSITPAGRSLLSPEAPASSKEEGEAR